MATVLMYLAGEDVFDWGADTLKWLALVLRIKFMGAASAKVINLLDTMQGRIQEHQDA